LIIIENKNTAAHFYSPDALLCLTAGGKVLIRNHNADHYRNWLPRKNYMAHLSSPFPGTRDRCLLTVALIYK
jgi:hypothetical protein